jgi:putative flippase GtrA
MLKFGAVGAVAFVVDVGLFNLLTTSLWPGAQEPPMDGHEKLAKVLSASVATVVAWLGNRYWTFRHRRQASRPREFATFALMNVIAMVIAVLCLTISHDVLGFTSTLADNIAGNVVGIGLGTLFRFWAYRTFVFTSFVDPRLHGLQEAPGGSPVVAPAGHAGRPAAAPAGPVSIDDLPLRPVDLVGELAAELDEITAARRETAHHAREHVPHVPRQD